MRRYRILTAVCVGLFLFGGMIGLSRLAAGLTTTSDARAHPRPDVLEPVAVVHNLVAGGPVTTTAVYTVTELGDYTFGANDVNELGQVAGSDIANSGYRHAFLWLPEPAYGLPAGLNDLGTLGGDESVAMALNDVGQVVGWSNTAAGRIRAFLWQNGVMIDLGLLPGTASKDSIAFDINNLGQVVGWSDAGDSGDKVNPGTAHFEAFLWQGGMTGLGTLNVGDKPNSYAYGINDAGQIVGRADANAAGDEHAVLWSGGIMDLGTLGGDESWAAGINNAGHVVGWAEIATGWPHAFLWKDGIMTDLNIPGTSNNASDINDAGEIVGESSGGAFVWYNGVVSYLNDLIDPDANITVALAESINNNGQIAGSQYLLTPICSGAEEVAAQVNAVGASPSCPAVDLIADQLEVTQAVQDLNNSVDLVSGKRTFVRFHVHSADGEHGVTAKLHVQQGSTEIWLEPLNGGGHIIMRKTPNRGVLDHAFLFELPSSMTQGTLSLTAEVNPNKNPTETDYENNKTGPVSVTFKPGPEMHLVLYEVNYQIGSTIYAPTLLDRNRLQAWLKAAYPIKTLGVTLREYEYGDGEVDGTKLVDPDCDDLNLFLQAKQIWDAAFDSSIPSGASYYAMVRDGGGFMRGCAKIGDRIASGPTGSGTMGWDTDGSYGDWYGGHEIGHGYGRKHAEFCGAVGGTSYPYANGRISPALSGNNALYGFNINNKAVYGPNWKDVMTYCTFEWVSDFTYEGLLSIFQAAPAIIVPDTSLIAAEDRLVVMGVIDPETAVVELQPLFVLPGVDDIEPRTPGDYDIVLRDDGGAELARYPFTPDTMHSGPAPTPDAGEIEWLVISEAVPYVSGTTQVDIEGPTGVLTSVTAGAAAPTVTLTTPNGGEVLSGDPVTVTWMASDLDGDPLTFNVQYSPDNGASWELLAQNITTNTTGIPSDNLIGSDQALFRVWASDGMHTAVDQSDAAFTVPNHLPMVEIVAPDKSATTTVTISQTAALVGTAYDADSGTMDAAQLTWTSDLDGLLGNGDQVTAVGLSIGEHTITFEANDGAGGVVSDTVQVSVVASLTDLPAVPDALLVGPTLITLDRVNGLFSGTLSVDNQQIGQSITWEVVASQPWVVLSQESGTTPFDTLTVTAADALLAPGIHTAVLTFTSPDLPGESYEVQVELIRDHRTYVPFVRR